MTLARGFNNIVSKYDNRTLGLELLAKGSLGSSLTPVVFDTGYISPEGPLDYNSNGDLRAG